MHNLKGFAKVHRTADVIVLSVRRSQQTGDITTATMIMMMAEINEIHYRQTAFALHLANKS